MGSFASPKMPKPPKVADVAPPPPPTEQQVTSEEQDARERARRAAQLSYGTRQTILTGPQGVVRPGLIGTKKLLGA
jgi:hypothetical protein